MDERETITLFDEKGEQAEFEVLGVITVEDNDYAILVPIDDEDEQAYVFRIDTDDNGEEILTQVEDDEEFEMVCEAWETLCEHEMDLDDDDFEVEFEDEYEDDYEDEED